jgi:hypothetical protein
MMSNSREFITGEDADAFIAGARKIRDGLDDFSSRMIGLAAAADRLSQYCAGLSVPNGAGDLAKMRPVIATILGSFGRTIGETANDMRLSADELSRKVRELELAARKRAS